MFHNLFYFCLGLCIAFLILSVIFFFIFDIWNIFNARTGRSVRKAVQSMEEKNAHISPLRRPAGSRHTEALQAEQQNTSSMETQVLSPEDAGFTLEEIQKEADQSHGMFRIEKYIMLIHTDEMA